VSWHVQGELVKLNKQREELYYFEGSRIVFTPQYHIERGHCCGSGCRHCPYEPKHEAGNIKLEKQFKSLKDERSS
jgi:hypothetical protein